MILQEFQNWAVSQGQVGNPVNPPTYIGQCVSLVQQYLAKVYGIPYKPRGDAKDWLTNPDVLTYFDKVSGMQDGDIIVYNGTYGNGSGHIGIANGGGILDQNGRKSLHVATGSIYTSPTKYAGLLRRKVTNMPTITDKKLRNQLVGLSLPEKFWPQNNDPNYGIGGDVQFLIDDLDRNPNKFQILYPPLENGVQNVIINGVTYVPKK